MKNSIRSVRAPNTKLFEAKRKCPSLIGGRHSLHYALISPAYSVFIYLVTGYGELKVSPAPSYKYAHMNSTDQPYWDNKTAQKTTDLEKGLVLGKM